MGGLHKFTTVLGVCIKPPYTNNDFGCVCVYKAPPTHTLTRVLGRFDTYKGGVRIKLIIIQICIKTMSVKGGVYAHEAYEAKKIKILCLLCEYMGPTSFLFIYTLLVCVCMFLCVSYDAHVCTYTRAPCRLW
jgi:hypothetical protein